jgi:putative CocE/NonD family hydrolase
MKDVRWARGGHWRAAAVLAWVWLPVAGLAQAPSAPPPGDEAAYDIRDDILIRTAEGATLSATVVRRRDVTQPQPALLTFDIYTDPVAFRARGREAADHGYAGVIVDARGKRLSPDPIVPYEHEAADAWAAVDWIAHQPWSDGRVAMRGGSYSGFTAWAATKRLHPALKTLVVSAAAIPGYGLPMYNNIFLNANYGWAFYVSDNRTLDNDTYGDRERWERLPGAWFASGRPYREIDQVDGTPNPFLQRWVRHPAYDAYWQAMVPYGEDFAHINIPVLTISGYYDDGQVSALRYLKEHNRYNPGAQHYLVIGPYDHFGTHHAQKDAVLRGYAIDPRAQFSTPDLAYQWLDYVLRGGAKPEVLADRINYEVMGANQWRHAPSLASLQAHAVRFYFSAAREHTGYRLQPRKPAAGSLAQTVDLADRRSENNTHSYPDPIIEAPLRGASGLMFASAPFKAARVISGSFAGELDVTLNKKDFDAAVTVFEQLPDGRLFHLAYWFGRASFARDATARALLAPGKAARLPFETTFVSRQLARGSRLVVLLDVNKNAMAQVNYGTGGDVSDESVADAGRPLKVLWHTDSYLRVPFER